MKPSNKGLRACQFLPFKKTRTPPPLVPLGLTKLRFQLNPKPPSPPLGSPSAARPGRRHSAGIAEGRAHHDAASDHDSHWHSKFKAGPVLTASGSLVSASASAAPLGSSCGALNWAGFRLARPGPGSSHVFNEPAIPAEADFKPTFGGHKTTEQTKVLLESDVYFSYCTVGKLRGRDCRSERTAVWPLAVSESTASKRNQDGVQEPRCRTGACEWSNRLIGS
jgi:hypothetical protein